MLLCSSSSDWTEGRGETKKSQTKYRVIEDKRGPGNASVFQIIFNRHLLSVCSLSPRPCGLDWGAIPRDVHTGKPKVDLQNWV